MKPMDKKGLVPRLRFGEFLGAGSWNKKELGSCLSRKPEYGINAPAVPYSESLPTYLRITDISEDGNFIASPKVSVAKKAQKENYLSEGDIVLARTGASVGKSYKYREIDGKLVFAGFLIRVKPDKKKLDSELLFQFLSTEQYWRWVAFSSARSGQPGINGAEYASLPLALPPSLKEQQKIAACLSSLDDLITAHSDKLEALKQHKKGLMQQLFPAAGENTPRLRFPEFQDGGEWEKTVLGSYLSRKPEYGINAPAVPYSDDLPTYLRITDISEDGKFIKNQKVSVEKEVQKENYLFEGDIVLARTGASVGKSYKYRKTDGELVFAGFLIRVKPDKEKLNSELLFQFLNTEQYWHWVASSSARSGQPGINGAEYASLPLALPPSLEEQQKIAACLSSLDDLITTQSEKIQALKTHKNGLMQQLFPAVDEEH